jgi:uncharacterized membrane protein
MNKVLKWVLIGLGIALVAFMIAIMVFTRFGDGGQFAGRLGGFPHRYGGMMFGMGFMMLFRLLIPLGVVVLAVFGVVSLVRNHQAKSLPAAPVLPTEPVTPARTCVKCGKPLEQDWTTCPFCGKKQ